VSTLTVNGTAAVATGYGLQVLAASATGAGARVELSLGMMMGAAAVFGFAVGL